MRFPYLGYFFRPLCCANINGAANHPPPLIGKEQPKKILVFLMVPHLCAEMEKCVIYDGGELKKQKYAQHYNPSPVPND